MKGLISLSSERITLMNKVEFEDMIKQYGVDLLRFCRMYLYSKEDGDDLYQDMLLTLWKKRDKIDYDANVKSYALSVAIRIAKNRRRTWSIRSRIAPESSYEQMLDSGTQIKLQDSKAKQSSDPEDIYVNQEQIIMVRNAANELPNKYRAVIYLYYSADLSIKEIASCLKLPENTVKTRLSRGRALLKERLEAMYYE